MGAAYRKALLRIAEWPIPEDMADTANAFMDVRAFANKKLGRDRDGNPFPAKPGRNATLPPPPQEAP